MFYKEVQLQHKPYNLHTLTREIQQQSGITFSYDAGKINADRKIKLSKDRMTVQEILALVRRKTGVGYKVVSGSHIIYTAPAGRGAKKQAVRKKARPQQQLQIRQEDNDTEDAPVVSSTGVPGDSSNSRQIIVVGDSATAAGYYFSGGGGGGGAYGGNYYPKYPKVTISVDEDDWDDPYDNLDYPAASTLGTPLGQRDAVAFVKSSIMVAGLVAADETYYFNPGVRGGLDFLYGTVSYNATGPFPHWRYGFGLSAPIRENWRIHLAANTGQRLNKAYNIQSFDTIPPQQDTLEQPTIVERNTGLQVQSKLTRVTLSFEWNAGRNFYLGAGLTFNHLRTNYFSSGKPVALSDILPVGYDADEKFRALDPPYLLGNTYQGNKSSNTKIWLGLQLTLIYRFSFFDR